MTKAALIGCDFVHSNLSHSLEAKPRSNGTPTLRCIIDHLFIPYKRHVHTSPRRPPQRNLPHRCVINTSTICFTNKLVLQNINASPSSLVFSLTPTRSRFLGEEVGNVASTELPIPCLCHLSLVACNQCFKNHEL